MVRLDSKSKPSSETDELPTHYEMSNQSQMWKASTERSLFCSTIHLARHGWPPGKIKFLPRTPLSPKAEEARIYVNRRLRVVRYALA